MNLRLLRISISLSVLACLGLAQQWRPYNYDESKVGTYTLPDLLVTENGKRVTSAAMWTEQRRPEILQMFATQMFGRTPPPPYKWRSGTVTTDNNVLGGLAVRKQVTIYFSDKNDGPQMHLLVYLPSRVRAPMPLFLGLNFFGNHTVSSDPGIQLNPVWVREPSDKTKFIRRNPDSSTRGSSAGQWQVEKILSHGYGLATVCYGDIEPDFVGGIQYGVRPLYFKPDETEPAPDAWGAIGAWAWGLSRALDYLETTGLIDKNRIVLMGHSRLGKTALWAGAQDTRFSIVISNESGEGGAALSKRDFGETIEHLNVAFPHWFCGNYHQYSNHPERLPFDSHMLLALIAPRPLYVASAAGDLGSDPKGEFLGAYNAGPVYQLFGKQGLGTDQMPPIESPIMHTVGYHIRAGKHDVTEYDWAQYLKFADMQFAANP